MQRHYNGEINLHEYWAVGDKRKCHLSAIPSIGSCESQPEQDVELVIVNKGGKQLVNLEGECAFIVQFHDCLASPGYLSDSDPTLFNNMSYGFDKMGRKSWLNDYSNFISSFPENVRKIFKEHYSVCGGMIQAASIALLFALPSEMEIFGTKKYAVDGGEGVQFEYYKTAQNRIKKINGVDSVYWTRSPSWLANNRRTYVGVSETGTSLYTYTPGLFGICPYGCI